MAIADAAQALASEQEYVRPELENYVLSLIAQGITPALCKN